MATAINIKPPRCTSLCVKGDYINLPGFQKIGLNMPRKCFYANLNDAFRFFLTFLRFWFAESTHEKHTRTSVELHHPWHVKSKWVSSFCRNPSHTFCRKNEIMKPCACRIWLFKLFLTVFGLLKLLLAFLGLFLNLAYFSFLNSFCHL